MKGLMTSGYKDRKVEICPHIEIEGLEFCGEGYGDQSSTKIVINCKSCEQKYPFSFEEFY